VCSAANDETGSANIAQKNINTNEILFKFIHLIFNIGDISSCQTFLAIKLNVFNFLNMLSPFMLFCKGFYSVQNKQ